MSTGRQRSSGSGCGHWYRARNDRSTQFCVVMSLLVGWTPLMRPLHLHQVDPERNAIPCPLVGSAVAEPDAFAGTGHGAIVPHNLYLVLSLLVGWTPLMRPLHLQQVDPERNGIPCPLVGSAVAEPDAFAGTGKERSFHTISI
jgi:hypothetical protein